MNDEKRLRELGTSFRQCWGIRNVLMKTFQLRAGLACTKCGESLNDRLGDAPTENFNTAAVLREASDESWILFVR